MSKHTILNYWIKITIWGRGT